MRRRLSSALPHRAGARIMRRPPFRPPLSARRGEPVPGPWRAAASTLRVEVDQPACKPGSVGPASELADVAAIPLGRPLPAASSNQPGRRAWRAGLPLPSREGACRPYSVLLPVGFAVPSALPRPRCALTAPFHPDLAKDEPCKAFCSLWHCPWGRPRRRLSGTASPWSPDFPPRLTTKRLPGRLIRGTDCAAGGAGSRLGGNFTPPPASPANRPPRRPSPRGARHP